MDASRRRQSGEGGFCLSFGVKGLEGQLIVTETSEPIISSLF